jgi:orotate phosphoribosyltransferase
VDTILCLDRTEVIGAFLADELQRAGVASLNQHKTIYILSPETDSSGQAILRDNTKFMVENKHVLILLGTATTGITLERSMQFVEYYGGELSGIACLFSAITRAAGMPVISLFGPKDLPDYRSYALGQCPLCQQKKHLDGIVNIYGYNKL